jgi:tRNA A37 threonylcarbamoyladenosine synthetase subunit TsaC/SUA5/YrdC
VTTIISSDPDALARLARVALTKPIAELLADRWWPGTMTLVPARRECAISAVDVAAATARLRQS